MMKQAQQLQKKMLAEKKVIYGLTTGFGEFQKVFVPPEDAKKLQKNLQVIKYRYTFAT